MRYNNPKMYSLKTSSKIYETKTQRWEEEIQKSLITINFQTPSLLIERINRQKNSKELNDATN